jgi:hypothetical protein
MLFFCSFIFFGCLDADDGLPRVLTRRVNEFALVLQEKHVMYSG